MSGKGYSSLFVSHGAPTLPISDVPARAFLSGLGSTLPRPRAIVALSPHWLAGGVEIKSPERYRTWHDFGGFPEELYDIQYTPAGEPAVAARVLELLRLPDFTIPLRRIQGRRNLHDRNVRGRKHQHQRHPDAVIEARVG